MADEIEFVNGLIVKAPHERAPDYVKASISIKVEDLGIWLREKHKAGEEWVNVDVKESKTGKWYAAVSNFKPKESNPNQERSTQNRERSAPRKADKFDDMDDDIPF